MLSSEPKLSGPPVAEPSTDFNLPGWLRYGSRSAVPGEPPVHAWGPFQVWLEDSRTQPAYVGSRLRFFWDRLSATRQVSFFPVEPPSIKILTLADDAWPERFSSGRSSTAGWKSNPCPQANSPTSVGAAT
jgi:hypothetical protein